MAQANAGTIPAPKGTKGQPKVHMKKKGLRNKGIKPKESKPKVEAPKVEVQVEVKKTRNFNPPTKEGTIAFTIWSAIQEGKLENNDILELVKKKHKGCNTTYACVAWYRSKKKQLEAK